jgi:hypothetical protein
MEFAQYHCIGPPANNLFYGSLHILHPRAASALTATPTTIRITISYICMYTAPHMTQQSSIENTLNEMFLVGQV